MGGHRRSAERHDALLRPLADALAEARIEKHVDELEPHDFRRPAAGRVQGLEDRLVAEIEAVVRAPGPTGACRRSSGSALAGSGPTRSASRAGRRRDCRRAPPYEEKSVEHLSATRCRAIDGGGQMFVAEEFEIDAQLAHGRGSEVGSFASAGSSGRRRSRSRPYETTVFRRQARSACRYALKARTSPCNSTDRRDSGQGEPSRLIRETLPAHGRRPTSIPRSADLFPVAVDRRSGTPRTSRRNDLAARAGGAYGNGDPFEATLMILSRELDSLRDSGFT